MHKELITIIEYGSINECFMKLRFNTIIINYLHTNHDLEFVKYNQRTYDWGEDDAWHGSHKLLYEQFIIVILQ